MGSIPISTTLADKTIDETASIILYALVAQWKSNGFLIRRSGVRIPPGVLQNNVVHDDNDNTIKHICLIQVSSFQRILV